jgi:hypothetical protein
MNGDDMNGGGRIAAGGFRPDGELAALVAAFIDGSPDAKQRARLEARLGVDPGARRYYIDAMLLDAALADQFSAAGITGMVDLLAPDSGEGPRPSPAADPPDGDAIVAEATARRRPWRPSRAAAAILLAVLAGGFGGGLAAWQGVRAAVGFWSAAPLAEISRSRLAVPRNDRAAAGLAKGRRLGRERLAIESGAVEIAVRSGVMIVLEGPAEIELEGEQLAFLHRGVAVVRGPAGVADFDLETPTARVVGRGGEFAAKVDPSLTTDVQVYSGEVVAAGVAKSGSGQFPLRIAAGEAVRFSSQSQSAPERIEYAERRFTRRLPDERGIALGGPGPAAGVNKWGRPRLESIAVTRAPGPVVIDGGLDDWSREGWFRAVLPGSPGGREWIEGRMMYDDERLYVAARVGDPLPLRNSVDPALDAARVWQGGGLQIFLSADRAVGWPADANGPAYYENRKIVAPFADRLKAENGRLLTLVMAHHAPDRTDRLFLGRTAAGFVPEPVAAGGYEGRFVAGADGAGYVLEYAIPWATLGVADDPPRAGDTLATAWELHFSDESGKLWRNQIVEIRNLGEPAGIYLFERAATWGRAEFR